MKREWEEESADFATLFLAANFRLRCESGKSS